jgi:hypothetical protein
MGNRENSQQRLQKTPNNWVTSKQEETKDGSRLPPISTPSIQSVKSTKAPSIVPRKALTKNSNKKTIANAIKQMIFAGMSE